MIGTSSGSGTGAHRLAPALLGDRDQGLAHAVLDLRAVRIVRLAEGREGVGDAHFVLPHRVDRTLHSLAKPIERLLGAGRRVMQRAASARVPIARGAHLRFFVLLTDAR